MSSVKYPNTVIDDIDDINRTDGTISNYIPKSVKSTLPVIFSRGYKLLDGDISLNIDDFDYNIDPVDEFHFRFTLEHEKGWDNKLTFILPLKDDLLLIDIKPRRKKCKLFIKSPDSLYKSGLGLQKIPRIIHQTFTQHQVTDKMSLVTKLTRTLNPEYNYFFYDNSRNYGVGLYYFLISDFKHHAKNIRDKLKFKNQVQLLRISDDKYLFKTLYKNYSQIVVDKIKCSIS